MEVKEVKKDLNVIIIFLRFTLKDRWFSILNWLSP